MSEEVTKPDGKAVEGATGHAIPALRSDSIAMFPAGPEVGPLAELAETLGRRPHDDEAVAWATMSPANRETTLKRIRVLERWVRDRGDLTAAAAAKQAEIGLSRWYDLAGRWSAGRRSIFDIGRYTRGQQDRKGRFDAGLLNELQGAVPRLVAEKDKDDSRLLPVARMVELLMASVDAKGRTFPKFNTLREMIERERRRVQTRSQVGTQPGFDLVGSGLLRADGRHHLIYGVVDRTSRLILGFALGEFEDSVGGHAKAARDALGRLATREFESVPWAGATERIDVVPGGDADAWRRMDVAACPVAFEFADSPKSVGGYFRRFVGPHLGRLRLSSVKSAIERRAVGDDDVIFDVDAALLRVRAEIAAHNAVVRSGLEVEGEPAPAPTLEEALGWLARLSA